LRRGRNPLPVLVPLVFLLVMTSWALIVNLVRFVEQGEWVLATLDAIIFVLAMWLIVEALGAISHARAERARGPSDTHGAGELGDGMTAGDGRPPETEAEAAARRDTRPGPGA
ncbi:MAG TPA: hypothetical protein VK908_16645, partial [Jiangellales bacterium]|nr:hypothetical protein [Jiangellales bacterium]